MVRLLLRHLLFELLVSLRFEDGCSTMFHLLWSCEVTISNSFMDPGSCWIHIIFVYLALSAAKQLSRSCILNHVNKFHEKWLRIYVTMTFKPHSHCLALSQQFASVHKEWSAVQNKALTSVGLTFAAVRASSWFPHGGTGMCRNCMFDISQNMCTDSKRHFQELCHFCITTPLSCCDSFKESKD